MSVHADTPAHTRAAAPTASRPATDVTDRDAAALLAAVDQAREVERTLAYVADRPGLRTRAETVLATEVEKLRRLLDELALDHAHLLNQCGAVLDHWTDTAAYGGTHHKRDRLRATVRGHAFDGHMLGQELDELGEQMGRVAR